MSGPDLYVLTVGFLALKKTCFSEKKKSSQKIKINFTFFLCNFSVRTLQCFQKKKFLTTKSWKNHAKKLHTYGSCEVFFLCSPTALNSPELHFRFINSFIQLSNVQLLRSLVETHMKFSVWTSLCFIQYFSGASFF